jgi:hypothetical protein
MGISIHSTPECAERYGVRALQPKQKYFAGGFTVMPLLVPHNAQCYAYVITTPDKKKILFYTDLYDFPYKVSGVTHILGEVNYCEEKVIDNLCAGGVSSKPENHLELSKAIEIVSRHKSPLLEKVVCLHLSDGNSNEREIKRRFYEELGIRVEIADKGMVINFDEDEF